MRNEKSTKLEVPPWLDRNASDKGVLFEILVIRAAMSERNLDLDSRKD